MTKMDQLEVSKKKHCWICFNSENNITLTNSEKIIKNCTTYLDTSIVIKCFESQLLVSCCSYCYESAHQLTSLEEQVEKLQNKISDLSLIFSKYVRERRSLMENEKDISPTKNAILSNENCITINKNPDDFSITTIECMNVKEEVIEIRPPDSLSDSHGEIGIDDQWLYVDRLETVKKNIIRSGNDIDVKSSHEEKLKVAPTVETLFVPNQPISAAIANKNSGQKIITSMADLLKCLKIPVIQLKRLQFCKTKKLTTVISKTSSNINLKINDPKTCPTLTSNYHPRENTSEPTLWPKNKEESVPLFNLPSNASVIAGGETVKCENDIDDNKPYKCSICGQGFLKLCDLEDHDKLHNKEGTATHNLTAHEIFGDTQFICSTCSKSFKSALQLKRHQRFHSKNRPFKCSFCSKSFRFSYVAKRHEMGHTGERPYKCSFCEKSFPQQSDVNRHQIVHSGKRPYKCSFCEKSFSRPSDVKQHEIVHSGKQPSFKCSFCEKSFIRSSDLKRHEIIHSDKRTYKCSFCEKSFNSSSGKKQHEMIHTADTGGQQHTCSFCPKSFRRTCHLKVHETIHTGEKPYKCSSCACPKSFISTRDLLKHERTHIKEEKAYKCSFCEKSYESVAKLKRHEKLHTNGRRFKCDSCENDIHAKSTFKITSKTQT